MAASNSGQTIDSTISYLLFGMFAIVFFMLTIFGMRHIEATAEQSSSLQQSTQEAGVEEVDINGLTQ